jgi:hypothetical protein
MCAATSLFTRVHHQMRVTQKASGRETFDPFLDELSRPFSLGGSLERFHFSLRLLISTLYTRTKIDTSETLARASELGLRSCLVLGFGLYMDIVRAKPVIIELNGFKVRCTCTPWWPRVRVRDGMKCARDRLYNQMGVTQNASGCETLNPFLDDLSCPFLLSGSLERLHFSLRLLI